MTNEILIVACKTFTEHQGDQLQLSKCPDRVIRIGADKTNLATVTFDLVDGTRATITLPVGTYPYHMINQLLNCTLTVNVYGKFTP